MYDYGKPFLLCVDDDPDILRQLGVFLGDRYNVVTAGTGQSALQTLQSLRPSIILLDVMMPEMDGYQVCARLQENPDTAWIPVIFISSLGEEQDRARAFAAGAVDYLVKPVNRQTVRELVETHQRTGLRWAETKKKTVNPGSGLRSSGSVQEYICGYLGLTGEAKGKMSASSDWEIYQVAAELGIDPVDIARAFAKFKGVPYIEFLGLDSIKLGALPTPFSKANNALVIEHRGEDILVLSNPFDLILQDSLSAVLEPSLLGRIAVTDPGNIALFFEKEPAPYLADRIIALAVRTRTPEIRIEAMERGYSLQFLHEGQFTEWTSLKLDLGMKLVARFKVFAGMATVERVRAHDGFYAHPVGDKSCQLRLTLSQTALGESLHIRIIDVAKL
jgi:CheY-like chemotaxis protein